MRIAPLFALALAGCFAPAAQEGGVATGLAFGPGELLDADVIASEPDLAALPDGTLLACAIPRRAEEEMVLWRRPAEGAWERIAHPAGGGLVDCAWSVDASGRAYYATSAGGSLTVATTDDASAWVAEASVGQGTFDRPWIAGGDPGRALLVAYDAARGLLSWATRDGGTTWEGPFAAQRVDQRIFQAFGDLAWLGAESFAYAYGPLERVGAGVAPHDVWLARTTDGGRTWAFEEVARDRGNFNHIFPAVAARDGVLHLAWAESASPGGPTVAYLVSGAPGGWGDPRALHGPDQTALMPRVLATAPGPLVVAYAAGGEVRPSFDEAEWGVLAWRGDERAVVAPIVHRGTIATGGYGSLAEHLLRNPGGRGSENSQALLHDLGATLLPDGRAVFAWASDAEAAVSCGPRLLGASHVCDDADVTIWAAMEAASARASP